jgi:hypothetical protein
MLDKKIVCTMQTPGFPRSVRPVVPPAPAFVIRDFPLHYYIVSKDFDMAIVGADFIHFRNHSSLFNPPLFVVITLPVIKVQRSCFFSSPLVTRLACTTSLDTATRKNISDACDMTIRSSLDVIRPRSSPHMTGRKIALLRYVKQSP